MISLLLPILAGLANPTWSGNEGSASELLWSQFRGPRGQGVALGTAELPDKLDPDANLSWRTPWKPGHSSPCVVGERIFLTGQEGTRLYTACFDRASGKQLWERSVRAPRIERTHRINGPASATPTSDGTRVYVAFGSFGLLAYDWEGQEVWRRPLDVPDNTFGTAASPILAGDLLIYPRDESGDSVLLALNPTDGRTVWRKNRAGFGSGWSTPTLRETAEGPELLVYGVWWLTAYGLDGQERWSVPGLADEPIVTPTLHGDLVFVSSYNMRTNPEVIGLPTFAELLSDYDADGDGALSKVEAAENESVLSRHDADGEGDHPLRIFFRFLDENRDGLINASEWEKMFGWLGSFEHRNALVAIRPAPTPSPAKEAPADREADDRSKTDPIGARVVWQHGTGVPECPSPLVYEGRVFLIKNGGILTCLEAETGRQLYQERTDARGPCYASPVAGDGKVYTASARGVVTVVRAAEGFEILSQTDLGERILATPALAESSVYVRTEQALYAFTAAP